MKYSTIATLLAFALVAALAVSPFVPKLVSAQVAPYFTTSGCSAPGSGYGFNYYPCTPGVLHVILQLNTYGYSYPAQPSDFTISIRPQNSAPITIPGSLTGNAFSIAGSYTVAANTVTGYSPNYSLGCNGTLTNGQEATCIITEVAGAPYAYGYPYFNTYNYNYNAYANSYTPYSSYNYPDYATVYPYQNYQGVGDLPPNVTLASVPTLPNTGFAPISPAVVAFLLVILSALGIALFPYVRKAIIAIG